MPKIIAALVVLLALAAGPALGQQLPVSVAPENETVGAPQPRLVLVGSATFDGGEVTAPTRVSHSFEIKNEGQAPLVLSEVRSSCGCVVSHHDPVIEPGETGRVSVTMSIYREWAGHEIRRATWVVSNDPVSPQLRLIISAKARPADSQ